MKDLLLPVGVVVCRRNGSNLEIERRRLADYVKEMCLRVC